MGMLHIGALLLVGRLVEADGRADRLADGLEDGQMLPGALSTCFAKARRSTKIQIHAIE